MNKDTKSDQVNHYSENHDSENEDQSVSIPFDDSVLLLRVTEIRDKPGKYPGGNLRFMPVKFGFILKVKEFLYFFPD